VFGLKECPLRNIVYNTKTNEVCRLFGFSNGEEDMEELPTKSDSMVNFLIDCDTFDNELNVINCIDAFSNEISISLETIATLMHPFDESVAIRASEMAAAFFSIYQNFLNE